MSCVTRERGTRSGARREMDVIRGDSGRVEYNSYSAARIAFAERACQGTRDNKGSPNVAIFAMLRPVEGEALLTIWEGNHVEKYDSLATEFRRHPTRSVVADGARK